MRLALILFSFSASLLGAQTPPPAPPPPSAVSNAPIDPEKLVLIRDLAAVRNLQAVAIPEIDRMANSELRIRPNDLPAETFDAVQAGLKAKEQSVDIVALVAPFYAASYSVAELRDLLAFFRSPTGQKFALRSGAIERQISNREVMVGRQMGAEARDELLQAHPEYASPALSPNAPSGFVASPLNNAEPNRPIPIGGMVAESNLIHRVEPVYPPLALSARVSGTVEFVAAITPEGTIDNLQLVRGHPLLVSAAKDAVLQWTYRPAMLNGNPVPAVTSIIVNFILPQ